MNIRLFYIPLIALLCALMVTACQDNPSSTGEGLLFENEKIVVGCDTFSTLSSIISAHEIYSTPDSFLLGECDSRFGTIHADILAQFTCPIGYEYPASAEVDSVCLFFYYTSWHGDGYSPMSLSIYEMDKQALNYNTPYSHAIDVNDYCTLADDNMVLGKQRILVAAHPTDSTYVSSVNTYVPYVRCRLSDEFAQRLFQKRNFESYDQFTQDFKGLYIQSDFGSSTLLHISNINMGVYYHFTYQIEGRDTTVNDVKGYYANSEVRQVNRYIYINKDMDKLLADSNSVNYIVSPANLYTRVTLPIRFMDESIGKVIGNKRPYINKAAIELDVLNAYEGNNPKCDDWAQPSAQMLLIKESALDRFFSSNELPSDTCALLAKLQSSTDANDSTRYYYSYDLSALLTQQLRNMASDTITPNYWLDMVLVPVSVSTATTGSYSTTTSIIGVKHEQIVTATVIRSAINEDNPLSLEVVYSGF